MYNTVMQSSASLLPISYHFDVTLSLVNIMVPIKDAINLINLASKPNDF